MLRFCQTQPLDSCLPGPPTHGAQCPSVLEGIFLPFAYHCATARACDTGCRKYIIKSGLLCGFLLPWLSCVWHHVYWQAVAKCTGHLYCQPNIKGERQTPPCSGQWGTWHALQQYYTCLHRTRWLRPMIHFFFASVFHFSATDCTISPQNALFRQTPSLLNPKP